MKTEVTHSSTFKFTFVWSHVLLALFWAGVSAIILSEIAGLFSEKYSELLAGRIAWNASVKSPDYLLPLVLILGFPLFYGTLLGLSAHIRSQKGAAAEEAFRNLTTYSLIPVGILIGAGIVRDAGTIPLPIAIEVAALSFFLTLSACFFSFWLARKKVDGLDETSYLKFPAYSLLTLIFASFSGVVLKNAIGRLYLPFQPQDFLQVLPLSVFLTLIAVVFLFNVWRIKHTSARAMEQSLRWLLWLSQGTLPLLFLQLIPAPWQTETEKFYGYPLKSSLIVCLAILILIAYWDWFTRRPLSLKAEYAVPQKQRSPLAPLGLVAILIFLKSYQVDAPVMSTDDYHWGEVMLPWWLLKNFGKIPFWDYEPSRGLVNYTPGFIAHLFFGDKPFAHVASISFLMPFHSGFGFLILSRVIGLFPAFVAILLMPSGNMVNEIDILMILCVCILGTAWLTLNRVNWLSLWLGIFLGFVLFAPGQGGLLAIATFPFAAIAFIQALRYDRSALLRKLLGFGISAGILAIFTPLGRMWFGAIRYALEQSSINTIAYGISWAQSTNANNFSTYHLWEILRTSWTLVGMLAGCLLLRAIVDRDWPQRDRCVVFCLPIFLLTILYISRAAGRIDPGSISRLGDASEWALCLALPILLVVSLDTRKHALALLGVGFSVGMLVGFPVPISLFEKPTQVIFPATAPITNAEAIGLPNLEGSIVESAHLQRLENIQSVLSTVLDPGETYLDLTNQNAHYVYLGYPTPVPSGAYYNLPHFGQQKRAISMLEADPPPIVLIEGETQVLDSLKVPFRTPYLYRYLQDHYLPVKIDEMLFLVKGDLLERLASLSSTHKVTIGETGEEKLALLDEGFLTPDFQQLPLAWGRSWKNLKSRLTPVRSVDASIPFQVHDLAETSPGKFQITGVNPAIEFDISTLELTGKDADILAFDFARKSCGKSLILSLRWNDTNNVSGGKNTIIQFAGRNEKLLVPLDTVPRWLLANELQTFRFEVFEPESCSEISISNIEFFQRSAS
jgi:hypothetical protein